MVLAAWALTLALLQGPLTATLWLGAVLAAGAGLKLVQDTCNARLSGLPAHIARIAMRICEIVSLAAGPMLCALAPAALAPVAALTMAAAWIAAMMIERRSVTSLILAAAPSASALPFVVSIALLRAQPEALLTLAWLGASLACFNVGLMRARAAADRLALDADHLGAALRETQRQNIAIWSIDFRSGALSGASELSNLLGRGIDKNAIVSGMLGAPSHDLDLARAFFTPDAGVTRQLYFAHASYAEAGAMLKLEHRALLHADSAGAPISLICITTIAGTEHNQLSLAEQWTKLHAHYDRAAEPQRLDERALSPLSEERRARA